MVYTSLLGFPYRFVYIDWGLPRKRHNMDIAITSEAFNGVILGLSIVRPIPAAGREIGRYVDL